jgi:hypothetical protein
MSSPETLNPLYKNLINKKIAKLPSVANIYGGQTEHPLEQRQKQHEEKDNKFRNMIIDEIFSSSKETQVKQINLAETYLIELLHTTYGKKCLNKVMVGGGGQHHNEGDNHKIYIMYK